MAPVSSEFVHHECGIWATLPPRMREYGRIRDDLAGSVLNVPLSWVMWR
jgi:hypothetical protein